MPVKPDMRRAGCVAHGVGDVVVSGVGPRPNPARRLAEGLGDAAARIPDLDLRRSRHAVVEAAAARAPRGHGPASKAEGQAPVDGPSDLELITRAGERLDEGEVGAV